MTRKQNAPEGAAETLLGLMDDIFAGGLRASQAGEAKGQAHGTHTAGSSVCSPKREGDGGGGWSRAEPRTGPQQPLFQTSPERTEGGLTAWEGGWQAPHTGQAASHEVGCCPMLGCTGVTAQPWITLCLPPKCWRHLPCFSPKGARTGQRAEGLGVSSQGRLGSPRKTRESP